MRTPKIQFHMSCITQDPALSPKNGAECGSSYSSCNGCHSRWRVKLQQAGQYCLQLHYISCCGCSGMSFLIITLILSYTCCCLYETLWGLSNLCWEHRGCPNLWWSHDPKVVTNEWTCATSLSSWSL